MKEEQQKSEVLQGATAFFVDTKSADSSYRFTCTEYIFKTFTCDLVGSENGFFLVPHMLSFFCGEVEHPVG